MAAYWSSSIYISDFASYLIPGKDLFTYQSDE